MIRLNLWCSGKTLDHWSKIITNGELVVVADEVAGAVKL